MKVGDIIVPWRRNEGSSYGLEYPFIFGPMGRPLRWTIWDRHTGRVVHVGAVHVEVSKCVLNFLGQSPDTSPGWYSEQDCRQKCRELNGIVETPDSRAFVAALHDAEP